MQAARLFLGFRGLNVNISVEPAQHARLHMRDVESCCVKSGTLVQLEYKHSFISIQDPTLMDNLCVGRG